jgi:hypothetical protein
MMRVASTNVQFSDHRTDGNATFFKAVLSKADRVQLAGYKVPDHLENFSWF